MMNPVNATELSIYKWLKWQSLRYVYLTTSKEKEQRKSTVISVEGSDSYASMHFWIILAILYIPTSQQR